MLKTQQQPRFRNDGSQRPDFAEQPQVGQESVWDYPRPPVVAEESRHVEVKYGDFEIASSHSALRILETASPPTVYLPAEDVNMQVLKINQKHSFCEWKGQASYYDFIIDGVQLPSVAWVYQQPREAFKAIRGYLCFYPSKVECFIDQEPVRPQKSVFYGGWITSDIAGPFKGDDETRLW